jgi:hypothetical protein
MIIRIRSVSFIRHLELPRPNYRRHTLLLVITMAGLPPPITDLHNVTAATPNLGEEDRRVSDEEKYQTDSEVSSPSESTVELQKRYAP